MSRKARNRMTRETIPEGFSAPRAFVDLLPVVFFGLSAVKAGNLFHSGLFVAGAVVCLLSGVVKVGWKLIAAVSQRNIWPMFVQMRILMPVQSGPDLVWAQKALQDVARRWTAFQLPHLQGLHSIRDFSSSLAGCAGIRLH